MILKRCQRCLLRGVFNIYFEQISSLILTFILLTGKSYNRSMFARLWVIAMKFIYSLYKTYCSIFTKNAGMLQLQHLGWKSCDIFFLREVLIQSGKGSPISTNQIPRNCKHPQGFQEHDINKFHKYIFPSCSVNYWRHWWCEVH